MPCWLFDAALLDNVDELSFGASRELFEIALLGVLLAQVIVVSVVSQFHVVLLGSTVILVQLEDDVAGERWHFGTIPSH